MTATPNKASTHYQLATTLLVDLPDQALVHFDIRVAAAQAHATLAVVDAIGELDSALRDLHETLRSNR